MEFKLIPKEPTQEMIDSMARSAHSNDGLGAEKFYRAMYKDLLAIAPVNEVSEVMEVLIARDKDLKAQTLVSAWQRLTSITVAETVCDADYLYNGGVADCIHAIQEMAKQMRETNLTKGETK